MKTTDQYYVLYPNALRATDRTIVEKASFLLVQDILVDLMNDCKALSEVGELTGWQVFLLFIQARNIWDGVRERQISDGCSYLVGPEIMNKYLNSLEATLLEYVKNYKSVIDVEAQDLQPTE